jgi:hypothetical protein
MGTGKTEPDLADTILAAAKAHGEDGEGKDGIVGYLRLLALNYPKEFQKLWASPRRR